jgi:hypothetical protein
MNILYYNKIQQIVVNLHNQMGKRDIRLFGLNMHQATRTYWGVKVITLLCTFLTSALVGVMG